MKMRDRVFLVAHIVILLEIIANVFFWLPSSLRGGYGWLYVLGLALAIRGFVLLFATTILYRVFPRRELLLTILGSGMMLIALLSR